MNPETTDLKALLGLVAAGQALSQAQAEAAFNIIMSGDATPSQIGAFLMALRVRGETVEEITGAAVTMRAKMLAIEAPEGAIDICGTGGDGTATFNISTASQFVLAACGLPVAKHGNRALSSKSGAADVLAALGVNLDADMDLVKQALAEAGTCFLMAPRHHSAMRHVGPTRVELGTRTIFNLLGPLANPARVKRQLIGVFSAAWVEPLAEVLKGLGHERAWVVHGDGMDEVTTTGVTQVAELKDGTVRRFEITPEDAGLDRASIDELRGGGAEENAEALRRLLDGDKGPYRDIVLMGSAAALMMVGKVDALTEGVAAAAKAIDSGGAKEVLAKLVRITTAKGEK
jgi:anthranilate phosphoribosyltransferase